MQPDKNIENEQSTRRVFIRKIGKTVLSVSVVGWVATAPRAVLACGEGASDSNCGGWFATDANCGVSGDRDESCGNWTGASTDANCGNSTTSGGTGGPKSGSVNLGVLGRII